MEEKKFNEAYQKYAGNILRYIYFKVSDYDTACDLTADTFARFWKVLNREPVVNSKAFLYSIANGIVIDHYRKKKNQKKISLESIDQRLLGFIDRSEDNLSKRQELEEVLVELKKLKKEYHDILLLYYVEELKVTEISVIFHKTQNNTRVILHRALQALKKQL